MYHDEHNKENLKYTEWIIRPYSATVLSVKMMRVSFMGISNWLSDTQHVYVT